MSELLSKAIRKVEDTTGRAILPETKKQQEVFSAFDQQLLNQHLTDLAYNSDACTSEIQFVQGTKDKRGNEIPDPHPDHHVIFNINASDESRLL